jgi:hypothetical protein
MSFRPYSIHRNMSENVVGLLRIEVVRVVAYHLNN